MRVLPCINNMKFSYRVTAAAMLVATLVVSYLTWGFDWITWNDKVTPRDATTASRLFTSSQQHRAVPGVRSLCRVGNKSIPMCCLSEFDGAKSDIRTSDILADIDRAMSRRKPSPDTLVGRRETSNLPPSSTKEPLKVIVVPHSHSDPGWHKTVEEYFEDQTKHTLDYMLAKLQKYPKMTFVWAESVFLHLWWQELSDQKKEAVRQIIKNGQLEIVVGSWVVPDEANPHYFALIDQMIEGHQWLETNLNVKPKNTWSLDPFGYSSTLPYLYKEAGYENMVILRVHRNVKEHLVRSKSLEFRWRQHWDKSNSTDIMTLMMPYMLYNIKHACGPDTRVCLQFDFRKIPGEWSDANAENITPQNVDRLARLLLDQYQKKASLYKHNVILIPLGDDFRYDRELEWEQQYKNYMALFDHMNAKKEWRVQARFGTVQDYFDEVRQYLNQTRQNVDEYFPSLTGDFFPYTDEREEYWTGYFTTRAFDKNLGREVEVHLRAAEILNTLALARHKEAFADYPVNVHRLTNARQNLGLFQHHDAITGTAQFFVVQDYENRLREALSSCEDTITSSMNILLMNKETGRSASVYSLDRPHGLRLLAPTKRTIKLNDTAFISVFNPIAQPRIDVVKTTVDRLNVVVKDDKGSVVPSQISPIWDKSGVLDPNHFELAFEVVLPPLALSVFHIITVPRNSPGMAMRATVTLHNFKDALDTSTMLLFNVTTRITDGIFLDSPKYRLRFSSRTGFLHSVMMKRGLRIAKTRINFLMYTSKADGAYIFHPDGPASDKDFSKRPLIRVVKGALYSEVQVVQNLFNHTLRLYNTNDWPLNHAIEINNVVDLRMMDNKEIIMRITTGVGNFNGTFYTDLNGFHVMKRRTYRNYPIEANYYPCSSFMYIEGNRTRVSLVSAQPLGVSSLTAGSMEVMLDRRLQFDDGRGLGEGVQDTKATPSRFFLLLERLSPAVPRAAANDPHVTVSYPSLTAHQLASRIRHYPITAFLKAEPGAEMLRSVQLLAEPLPADTHLVNLRSISGLDLTRPVAAAVFHRVGFDCSLTVTGQTDPCCAQDGGGTSLMKLFTDVKVALAKETTLSLMHEKRRIDVDKLLHWEPMHLYAYKVHFS